MKKILFAVMAVAAIGFTSCGNKTAAPAEAVDSVAIIDSLAAEAAEGTISALTEQIEAQDANKLQETLEAVKVKIAELVASNPEIAKEYVTKVQTFLKENADKVKAVVGDNVAVAAALGAVTEMEPQSVVNSLVGNATETVNNAANEAVDAAKEKVEEAKTAVEDAAKQKAEEAKQAAKDKANEAIGNAAKDAKKALGL